MAGEIFISREVLARVGIDGTQDTKTLTLANTEYSWTVPDNVKRLIFGMRSGNTSFRYGWSTGATNFTVPTGAFRDCSDVYLVGKTLFLICPDNAAEVIELEYWT